MLSDRITFAQFDDVLEELGFQKKVIRGSHVNYYHSKMNTPLMIRLHKPKDIVPGYVLLSTRVELENFGIVAAEVFDEMLQSAAA